MNGLVAKSSGAVRIYDGIRAHKLLEAGHDLRDDHIEAVLIARSVCCSEVVPLIV